MRKIESRKKKKKKHFNKPMADYKCEGCGETKKLYKRSMTMIDGKLITKEALCEGGKYMDQVITDEYEGLPEIHRNEQNTGHNTGG